jgi:ubiquinone biosynthesis protein
MTPGRDRLLQARRTLELWWTVMRFGVPMLVRLVLPLRRGADELPVRIRMALEDLGLTYVKLGQYLAMRFDILPAAVCRELGKLFDDVAPLPLERAREVIESELGAPLDELFSSFAAEPLAAASVAQVHEARTRAGEKVAVKVQRPDIERVFRADIRVLRRITRVIDAFHLLGRLSATEMLDQFSGWTLRETDFVQEGRTAEQVGEMREDYEVEPKVHWDLVTSKVLTLEFIEGVTLAQVVRVIEEGGPELLAELHPTFDVDLILHHLTFASLRQIFVTGLFHGDPHPGNILVLDDNRVAFVDFGIFGRLTPYDREILGAQIEQLAVGNIDESLRFYSKQLTITEESDARAFRAEARAVLQEWYDLSVRDDSPVAARHLGKYIGQMIDISRRYRLLYDMSFLLYWRALNALDSTALRMSPTFDLMAELRAFFEEVRPGFLERLAEIARDQRRLSVARRVKQQLPERVAAMVDGAASGRSETTLLSGERGERRRARNHETRWLGAAAAALSLLVLSDAHGHGTVAAALALGAGAAMCLLAVARLRPR